LKDKTVEAMLHITNRRSFHVGAKEETMKRIFMVFALVALAASACKKNQPAPVSQEQAAPTEQAAPEVKKTEVAQGDIKDLLLALKRVHFPFDASTLTPESKTALDEASEKLRANTEITLYVDGHTDERGTTEYNMSLGERRAQTVVKYLADSGVDQARLTIVSFGKEKPLAQGGTDVANAENRRVDFRLMKGEVQFVLEDSELIGDDGKPLSTVKEQPASAPTSSEAAPAAGSQG
jgi:peptidoglycan-associated lipoprotein